MKERIDLLATDLYNDVVRTLENEPDLDTETAINIAHKVAQVFSGLLCLQLLATRQLADKDIQRELTVAQAVDAAYQEPTVEPVQQSGWCWGDTKPTS